MAKDYYDILGTSKSASQDEIKRAYRKLAHQYHPDKKGGDEAKFKEVNQAYQVLGKADKRKQYDQFGQTFDQAGGGGSAGFGGMNWEDFTRASGGAEQYGGGFRQQNVEFDMGDLGDIFGDLFGMGRAAGSRRRRGSAGGNDIQTEMTIEFREAVFGAEKTVSLYKNVVCPHCSGNGAEPGTKIAACKTCGGQGQVEQVQRTILGAFRTARLCPDCQGEGKVADQKCKECRGQGRVKKEEQLKIKIPAGLSDGESIRLAGKGEAGSRGRQAGDLFIAFRVKPDAEFKREGDDIVSEIQISFSQAALGDKVPINALDGQVMLKIPAGTQSGKVFKLKDKGVPHLRTRGRGDHLVTVIVTTPSHLSRQEKKLFEELALR